MLLRRRSKTHLPLRHAATSPPPPSSKPNPNGSATEPSTTPWRKRNTSALSMPSKTSSSPFSPIPPSPLPLSTISQLSDDLRLPFRAIRFIRKYPSAFLEEPPSSETHLRQPTISPTPALSLLHEEEKFVYHSSKGETADRLLRLLMLSPFKRLPLKLITHLSWDLGLPPDYPQSLIPEYPDYFQISPGRGDSLDLELVCWKKDLALSAMEIRGMKTGGYKKGAPLAFPMQFSRGFQMEKKVKKWVEDFQRLPYLSPYEDSGRCVDPGSQLAEKWTVGMLHEILSLMIGKKAEKEDVILLGELLGLKAGFKRALLQYPGVFYQSNKNREHTILLREGYKRDILVEKHPLMGMRFQYIRLMRQSSAMDAATAPAHAGENLVEEFVGGEDDEDDDEEGDEDEGEEEESTFVSSSSDQRGSCC